MCGCFGAIGHDIDPIVIRSLAITNRERGTDSLGFVNSKNKIWKKADDPLTLLSTDSCNKYLETLSDCWFVLGHTRLGTRGLTTDRNAHPFQKSNYIGVHNGIVHAPQKFEVDSEYIWYKLKKEKGDYQKAWGDMGGNWSLAWTDGEHVFLQAFNQVLSMTIYNGIVYFSSDWSHLEASLGVNQTHQFEDGETWKFFEKGHAEKIDKLENSYTYAGHYYNHVNATYTPQKSIGYQDTNTVTNTNLIIPEEYNNLEENIFYEDEEFTYHKNRGWERINENHKYDNDAWAKDYEEYTQQYDT